MRFILGVQEIAHALYTQNFASKARYLEYYKKNILGKAPADIEKAYPEYERAREVSKMMSKVIIGLICCIVIIFYQVKFF